LNIIQNNVYKGNNKANNIFGNQNSIAINNLFYNECRNTVNPIHLKEALMDPYRAADGKNFNFTSSRVLKDSDNYHPDSRLHDEFKPENSQAKEMKNIYKSNIFLGDLGEINNH